MQGPALPVWLEDAACGPALPAAGTGGVRGFQDRGHVLSLEGWLEGAELSMAEAMRLARDQTAGA